MYYIFRKSDGVILYISHTLQQLENEKQACLANEGGTLDDYTIIEGATRPRGMTPVLDADGQVDFALSETTVAKRAARASLGAKLQALGLTAEEVALL
jgi:hypothetical protein